MPGWMVQLGDGEAIDVRGILVDVIKYHQRPTAGACTCGWFEIGGSHAEHVADVFEESVEARVLDLPPVGPERFYGELKTTLERSAEDCDSRGFPKSLCDRFRAAADVCDRAAGSADIA